MMQNDIQDVLSGMLADWHHFCNPPKMGISGYAGRSAVFGRSISSSQYDWENNVESEKIDRMMMEGFDAAANRVPQPWLTALQFEARELAVGYAVWSSPRLPHDPAEREVMNLEARVRLLRELAKDGVLC